MAFSLNTVVPWGRSFKEYEQMFALTPGDLSGKILGCADGPASFNAEATRKGTRVVSCDPLYQYNSSEIRERIDATYHEIVDQTRENSHEFIWTEFASPDNLGQVRMNAMENFLDDYDAGLGQGHYIAEELPSLSFDNGTFDLALCSHFLFLYTDQLTEDFHYRALLELSRVAHEIRVFPLIALGGKLSRYVETVSSRLRESCLDVTIKKVPYEFVRGANKMMCVHPTDG